jgi:hexosaminidase
MCPSNPETKLLVKSMIRQVVEFDSGIKYLHIGADEVWHLGLCTVCSKRASLNKFGKSYLFMDHVTAVAQFIKRSYPNLNIIMWDDMLRSMDLEILNGFFKLFKTYQLCLII